MKERPILFNSPMVRAILAGRKTQTRRPVRGASDAVRPALSGGLWGLYTDADHVGPLTCPFGAPGDRLWVRETWASDVPGCERGLSYRVDHRDPLGDGPANPMRWRPSIHMPRWASRLTLEITGVRVERVRDITEADAQAEGIQQDDEDEWFGGESKDGGAIVCSTARGAFAHLWESVYGLGSWGRNGWVWVVEFRKIDQPAQSA